MGFINWFKKKTNHNKINLLIIFIFLNVLIFSGAICRPIGIPAVELIVWNVLDDKKNWDEMINSYKALVESDKTRAKVNITYELKTYKNYKEFEDEFNTALIGGIGPDIITFNSIWFPRFKNKIYPLDKGTSVAQDFKKKFVDVVSSDFLEGNKIYAMPLSMDTLALYYNIDLLNNARVFYPPRTWDEFSEAVKRITKSDEKGTILRAGAAIGTDKNVDHSSDILSLLMLQGGSTITDASQKIATFTESISGTVSEINLGQEKTVGGVAFQLYTDYANPAKAVYTWNPLLDNSIDAFAKGDAAMMINYSYNIPIVREKNPKLKFAIAPVPQYTGITVPVNYANYWVMAVSSASKRPQDAWDFLEYITDSEINKQYLAKTSKPAVQRDLVIWQENLQTDFNDLNLAVFARQSLTAKSWYQQDNFAIETIFNDAINSIVLGRSNPEKASILAASQLNQIMKK